MDIDSELLDSVAAGDGGALTSLMERRGALVSAFVHRRCGGDMNAEEIVNDVWVACWRGASSFRNECSVRTWLLGIARNQLMSRYRTQSRRPRMVELPDVLADTKSGPLDHVLIQEGENSLVAAIKSLSPKHYETAMLAWYEDLPYSEIAKILDIPEGTVKSRVSHARTYLQKVLTPTQSEPLSQKDNFQ